MEQPPAHVDSIFKQYLIRVFDLLERRINNKDVLQPTTAMPSRPIVGKLYFFPNTISPTITTAGVWVYKSSGWQFCGSTGGGASLSDAWPVGSIYIATVATNPATLLGFGTWAAFGSGRTLIGIDTGDVDFDTAEEVGGAKTKAISAHTGTAVANHGSHTHTYTDVLNHTHSVNITDPTHNHAQNPHNHTQDAHNHTQNAHTHTQSVNSATTGALSGYGVDTSTNNSVTSGYSTGSTTATNQAATATNQAATATNIAAATGITATTNNPAGGLATGTTAGPSATLTHTVTQPDNHSAINVVQPYIVTYMWKRTS